MRRALLQVRSCSGACACCVSLTAGPCSLSAAWFKHILNFVYDHEQIQDLIVQPSDVAERKEFRSAFGKAAHKLALALAMSWISVTRMPPADALCIQPDSISTRHGSMVRVSRMSEGELRCGAWCRHAAMQLLTLCV